MKILVVDDNRTMRNIIINLFKKEDFIVYSAENGSEAISILIENKDIELITLDVEMPRMNGFEILNMIRNDERYAEKINSEIPIIFVTGSDTLDDRIKGFDLGISDFISKVDIKKELISHVYRLIDPQKEFQNSHILLVDDSKLARNVSTDIMQTITSKITETSSGNKAKKIISENPKKFDLIITDYYMDDGDGYELTKYIRNHLNLREVPIIVLTAYSERSKLIDFFKVGISDYIVKPFFKEEFEARVRGHLQKYIDHKKMLKHVKEKQKAFDKIEKLRDDIFEIERKNLSLAMAVTANHEINQPLMIIKGNIEILFSKISNKVEKEDLKHFNKITKSIERIKGILEKMTEIEEINLKNYSKHTQMIDIE